ncbi:MAG: FAD-binding oxidoreductase, partial [Ectothiorhodospira sp.]
DSMEAAARAVSRIMAQPVVPCALEFMDGPSIAMIRPYSTVPLPDGAGGLLMIEVDGPVAGLTEATDRVAEAARGEGCLSVTQAGSGEEVKALWATRKALSPALRQVAPKKINEDVAVPVSRMPDLIREVEALSREYGIPIVCFGHAGNGNIHVNLLVDPDDPRQMTAATPCLDRLFERVLSLEGTLSGEHGVGIAKRDYVERELTPEALDLMHGIKTCFDPADILNPGKGMPPKERPGG